MNAFVSGHRRARLRYIRFHALVHDVLGTVRIVDGRTIPMRSYDVVLLLLTSERGEY